MSKPRKKMKGHTRQCAGKQAFNTEDAARNAGKFDGMTPYKCRKCKKHHFGH